MPDIPDHRGSRPSMGFATLVPVRYRSVRQRPYPLSGLVALAFGMAAAAFGIWARIEGLGTWSSGEEEYRSMQAARQILQSGVPALQCGGYYGQGLALQYIYALGLWFGAGNDEYVLRAINTALGMAGVPALFLLARKLIHLPAAFVLAGMYLLSVWELELARCACGDGAFHAVFLWYLWFFYRFNLDYRNSAMAGMWALSLLGVLFADSGVLIVALNLLPLLLQGQARQVKYILLSLSSVLWAAFFLYAGDRLSTDAAFTMPKLLLAGLPAAQLGLWTTWSALFVMSGFIAWGLLRDKSYLVITRWSLLLALAAMTINLLTMAAALVLIALTLDWMRLSSMGQSNLQRWLAAMMAWPVFWLLFAMVDVNWQALPEPGTGSYMDHVSAWFGFPELFRNVFLPWYAAMPIWILALSAIVTAGWCWVLIRPNTEAHAFRLLLVVMLLLFFAVGLFPQSDTMIPHASFVYPLLMLLAFCSMTILGTATGLKHNQALAMLAMTAVFFAGEDFDIQHLRYISDSDSYIDRGWSAARKALWHYDLDYKTPCLFINQEAGAQDIVVSFAAAPHYYLHRLDYRFLESGASQAPVVLCDDVREVPMSSEPKARGESDGISTSCTSQPDLVYKEVVERVGAPKRRRLSFSGADQVRGPAADNVFLGNRDGGWCVYILLDSAGCST